MSLERKAQLGTRLSQPGLETPPPGVPALPAPARPAARSLARRGPVERRPLLLQGPRPGPQPGLELFEFREGAPGFVGSSQALEHSTPLQVEFGLIAL